LQKYDEQVQREELWSRRHVGHSDEIDEEGSAFRCTMQGMDPKYDGIAEEEGAVEEPEGVRLVELSRSCTLHLDEHPRKVNKDGGGHEKGQCEELLGKRVE